MITLVSFDVDGTLIKSVGEKANQLHKQAFSHCFRAVFGVDTDIDVVQHHGGTDPLIIKKVLEHFGFSGTQVMERLQDLQDAMLRYYDEHRATAGDGLEVLPGVVDLLEALKLRGDVATCLVTGNLEPIGWAKMEASGIRHLFTEPNFGGFGSDFCSGDTSCMWRDRGEMIRIAAKKATEILPGGISAHYHIGDTPQDLYAAASAGASGVGVATGIFGREELEDCNTGGVVLDGLSDVGSVLRTLGLEEPNGEMRPAV